MPTNPLNLEEIKGLMAAATDGPWKATSNAYGCNFVQRWEAGTEHGLICGGNNHDTLTVEDALLIAALRNQVPALIEQYERMAGALETLLTKPNDMLAVAYATTVLRKAKEGRS